MREKSDFLRYRDSAGRFADFHANRHTFITNLGRAGVSPKLTQELARHSDIRLTLGVYTHVNLADKVDAVQRLPQPWERFGSEPKSQDDKNGREVAPTGGKEEDIEPEVNCHK